MKKCLIVIGVICVLLTHSLVAVAAGEAGEAGAQEKVKAQLMRKLNNTPSSECQSTLVPLMDIELKEFLDFLNQTFQNKSSTSSLTNLAIARYNEFKVNIENLFDRLNFDSEQANIAATNAAFGLCSALLEEYYSAGKKLLFDHIKQTNATKTATIMLEKYQAINNQLRDLNMTISQMFGYFSAFKNVFPGFLKQCITSG